MFQLDNFIFFDEIVKIVVLFVYILLCIYVSPYFFKSNTFSCLFFKTKMFYKQSNLLQFNFTISVFARCNIFYVYAQGFLSKKVTSIF